MSQPISPSDLIRESSIQSDSGLIRVLSRNTDKCDEPHLKVLSPTERHILTLLIARLATEPLAQVDIPAFCTGHRIELNMLGPNVNLVVAIWFEVFKHLELNNLAKMKYDKLSSFIEAYPEFAEYDEEEAGKLMGLANWVGIMTQFIPAKANKGLMIGVIPKYVEGYAIRYVTGSGQKKTTQDRVHVYEIEGNVKAVQRNTVRKHHSSEYSAPKHHNKSTTKSSSKKKYTYDDESEVSPRPTKRNRSNGYSNEQMPAVSAESVDKALSQLDIDIISDADDNTDTYNSSNDDSNGQDGASGEYDDVTSELSEEPLDLDFEEIDTYVLEKPPMLRNFTWGTDASKIGGGYNAAADDLLISVPDHKSLAFSGSSMLPPDLVLSQTILA